MSTEVSIVGIDPGPTHSAFVVLQNGKIKPDEYGWLENEELRKLLAEAAPNEFRYALIDHLAIETLHPRAEPVSLLAMQAQLWAGRFIEAAGVEFTCVDERDARFEATGNPSAKNKDVFVGLLNIFGEDRQVACQCGTGVVAGAREGKTKKCPVCKGRQYVVVPGPLAGMNEHCRSALAAAYRVWVKKFRRAV